MGPEGGHQGGMVVADRHPGGDRRDAGELHRRVPAPRARPDRRGGRHRADGRGPRAKANGAAKADPAVRPAAAGGPANGTGQARRPVEGRDGAAKADGRRDRGDPGEGDQGDDGNRHEGRRQGRHGEAARTSGSPRPPAAAPQPQGQRCASPPVRMTAAQMSVAGDCELLGGFRTIGDDWSRPGRGRGRVTRRTSCSAGCAGDRRGAAAVARRRQRAGGRCRDGGQPPSGDRPPGGAARPTAAAAPPGGGATAAGMGGAATGRRDQHGRRPGGRREDLRVTSGSW